MSTEATKRADSAVWSEFGLSVNERFIEAGDARRRVRMLECGDPAGEPLVFVQGGLGEGFAWASLMTRLRQFRCITLDRPGGGLSDGVDFTQVDPRQLAIEVLDAVLHASGLQQAPFVANSMGGWWSVQLATARPARVSKLVLVGCPALLAGTSAPLPMRLMSLPVIGPRMVSLMVPSSPAKARTVAAVLGHPKEIGERWSAAEAEAHHRFGNLPNFRRSWSTLLRRFLRLGGGRPEMQITAEQLRSVAQPTLFIWGAKDPFGSVDAGRAAAQIMPSARLEVVGVGHLPWWDDPERCAHLIREFVRSRAAS
jgi:pimeloyl-ACP methyl ester carboxylesterase